MTQKHRLITRSDLDGITCAALLKELDMVEEIKFAHPKDMQDGTIEITGNDIITNLPYHPNAAMVFDHHASEVERNSGNALPENVINDPTAPSAAHVIYRHYGGATKFTGISPQLMDATNKIDAAQLSMEDILNPEGWTLLGFIMDNRTGLGRFRNFRISNYQLMMELVDILRKNSGSIEDILRHPDVAERAVMYKEHNKLARQQIMRCSAVHEKLVVADLRNEKEIFTTNRFTIYAMYPNCNISMHIMPGKQNVNTVFAVGKSVLDRSSSLDVGSLMLAYGGGGHKAVGTCQIDNDKASDVKNELISKITAAG
ncbi:MAG: exopolyphosphatase [Alphaproteobacteria bacterium]|nr:exopolyphosphatase [Alphaproteobacteria bacterium]